MFGNDSYISSILFSRNTTIICVFIAPSQKYKHLTVDSIKKKQQQAAEPQQVAASSLNTQQTEMVAMFSQQSGMNSHYSFMFVSFS